MPRVTITVPGKSPQPYRFQLDCRLVSMGRGSKNDIVIDCGSVSVSHAEMRRIPGGFELADLQSTNGIKLDGERHMVIALHDGMSLKLGEVAFDFQLSEEELAQLAHEQAATELPPLPEVEPVHVAPPVRRPTLKVHQAEPNAGAVFWLLVLALTAFIVGMAIRFEKDTGESWLKAVMSRGQEVTSGTESGN